MQILGIFREVLHSPQREFDDYEILRLTGEELKKQGCEVHLMEPQELMDDRDLLSRLQPDLIFMMCEQEAILKKIAQWESLYKKSAVNSTPSIYATYRFRMIPALAAAGVPLPWGAFADTHKFIAAEDTPAEKIWVKRGDVHNTTAEDVVLTDSPLALEAAVRRFGERGIVQVLLQAHVPGDLIKYYGVGHSEKNQWFRWFYHKNQVLNKFPFSESQLKSITARAAKSIGLEVYGGDAIITAQGEIYLIDLNAWPSFALFRPEASAQIASHIAQNCRSEACLAPTVHEIHTH